MISDLLALGVLSTASYDTPPGRTILLPPIHRPNKLPGKLIGDNFDYRLDWSLRLGGDVIASFAVDVPNGAVVASRAIYDASTTSFWLAGGVSGAVSMVRALAHTAGGRTFEELLPIRCF